MQRLIPFVLILTLGLGCKEKAPTPEPVESKAPMTRPRPLGLMKSRSLRRSMKKIIEEDFTRVPVASVLEHLKQSHSPGLDRAIQVFKAQPVKAVKALTPLLESPNVLTRINSVRILGYLAPHSQAALGDLLIRLDKEPNTKTLSMVIDTLRLIAPHTPSLEKRLVELLASPSPLVVWQSVKTLGAFGKKASGAVDALKKQLTSKENYIRLEAANALWKISGTMKGFSDIARDLDDSDRNFRKKFIVILSELPPEQPLVVDLLIKALEDPSVANRRQAAIALKKRAAFARKALPALKKATTHKDYSLRKYATDAIAAIEKIP